MDRQFTTEYMTEGKTVAFIGSSGVGKSTLINCLLGEALLDIQGLRNQVSFEFRQCGTRFIKDGKEHILQKKYLCFQVRKADINYYSVK